MPDINSNLIRNMGHDVRTSVSSILGLSALAGANVHDKERVMEYMNNINITARQLLDYVDEVMNAVNVNQDDNAEKQEINMHDLV
ncbi:MAG: histidine kinase dimerization/phospho-acceptor domain-containing protein, partial [Wujia sp.]